MEVYLHALFYWAVVAAFGRWYYAEMQLKEERRWHKHYREMSIRDTEFALKLLDKLNEEANEQ